MQLVIAFREKALVVRQVANNKSDFMK